LVTWVEHVGPSSARKKKKKEEVQNIETNEEDNASEEDGTGSPAGGGGDKVTGEGAQRNIASYVVEPRSVYNAIFSRKCRIGG
jgi:hypothetical protein